MTNKDVIEIYGKSIWDMTTAELIEYKLDNLWTELIDETFENESEDDYE